MLFAPRELDLLDARDEFRVSGTPWYLDARSPRSRSIVSHAHADHLGRHGLSIATPATCDLLRHRLGQRETQAGLFGRAPTGNVLPLDYSQVHEDGDTQIELLPAGHVLGSAMARITTPRGTLLYTGDFRLVGDALTVPACCPPAGGVDVLLMECTYGLPRYRMPPRDQVIERLCDLVAGALAGGRQPVCLCYSLGKAQEVARILSDHGFAISMHDAPYAISHIYARHGVDVGNFQPYARNTLAGTVLIAPPHIRHARVLQSIPDAEFIAVTGWALDPSAKYRYAAHHALPISDHADFDELVAFVEQVNPRRVLLTHGYVEEMCRHLQRKGFDARPAVENPQGSLFEM